MTPSQHLLELNLNLQHRIAQLEQDNQQLQAELTQLRQEHEQLQQSATRYRQLFENAPISMLFINTEGYITQMNRAAEQQFGLSLEQLNQQACPIFTNLQLVENGTLPYMLRALAGETVIEEPTYYDSSKDFDGGKFQYGKGHYFPIRDSEEVVREILEINPDFADLLVAQQRLQQERERAATERIELLSTIAQVANLLLRSPDYTSVLPDVVRLLGEAVGSDRCAIMSTQAYPVCPLSPIQEVSVWCKNGVPSGYECTPELALMLWQDCPELYQRLLQAEIANYFVTDLSQSSRDLFVAQGVSSIVYLPIIVSGQPWGQIGFDNCRAPRLFDEAEIAILKIAADSIAAAIERREKDDELRRSEALYRSLFEISNEGIYRWELDQPISLNLSAQEQVDLVYANSRVTQANDAYLAMSRISNIEDMAHLRLVDLHVEDSEKNQSFMLTCAENKWRIRNAESEEIDVNGQKRYFLNSVISFIENEQVTSGWGTQIDITELREAQQALLAEEQARAQLLKTMTTIANHLLRATDYTLILPDVLQLLGEAARADRCSLAQNITDPASGKSAVRMNAEWCRPGIQASVAYTPELESALLWEDFAELYERLIQGETVQFFGTDLCASLRELFDSQGNKAMLMVPIVVQGEFWGVFGFDYCHEVRRFEEIDQSIFAIAVDSIAAAIERQQQDEALRESEKRYRTLFELSNEGIYRFEFEQPISILLPTSEQIEQAYRYYRIAEVNSTFVTQYGLTNQDELIGSGLVDTHVPDSEVNYEHARTIIENGYSGRNVETEEIESEGQRKYFLQNVVCDVRNGYLWGGWGTQTDITKLKQAQHSLLQAEQAVFIEREQAAQARAAELAKANEVLKNTLDTLATEPELDCFLRHILSVIAQQMNAPACLLWLFDESLQTAILHLSYTDGQVKLPARVNADQARPLCLHSSSWVFCTEQRQPYLVEVATPPFTRASCAYLTRSGVKAILIVPLWLGDQLIGSFGVRLPEVRDFAPNELELVQALAHQATLALQLMQLTEQASHSAVLEERNRMAREIHDVLAQAFTGVVVQLEAAKMITPQNAPLQPLFAQAQDLARAGLVEARRSVWSLRPQALENTNLRSALEQLVQTLAHKTPVQLHLQIQGADYALAPEVETHLLRIAQEALTNALTHAQASTIQIELTFGTQAVELCVRDDGQGFEPTAVRGNGFGLVSMQERADCINGEFTLTSQPGCGTIVLIAVPLSAKSNAPIRRS